MFAVEKISQIGVKTVTRFSFCCLQSLEWGLVMLLTCSVVLIVMATVTSSMEGNGGVVVLGIPVAWLP